MDELEAFAILTSIPHLGPVKVRHLLQLSGSACEALKTPISQLNLIAGFEKIIPFWEEWKTDSSWQHNIELAQRHGAKLIPFTHPQFPKSLHNYSDHPILLYVRGEIKSSDQRSIAVVGTRNASIYGNEMAEKISYDLAAHGFTVVSGLARGIDTSAHQGALKKGRTIAVIGSGLSRIYPSENQSLANSIAEQGALISEFPMMTPPDRQNFPQRNRIVSGMTWGTLLIEAPIKSGAMITMDKAFQQKKKLFVLPGRVDNENFKGNHHLIKTQKATLIENAEDIICHFQELFSLPSLKTSERFLPQLDHEESQVFEIMPIEEISIDELSSLASLPIHHIHRVLMSLVLKKAIKEFPGKIYKKLLIGNEIKRKR